MPCFYVFVLKVDQIYHLASPASPPNYMYNPIKTLKTNTIGTLNMLGECTQSQLLSRDLNLNLNWIFLIYFLIFFWWLFPNPCVCSKVWPSVWGPDCCWLLLQRFMGVRETLPNHLWVLPPTPPPDDHIEFSHQSGCCLMGSFGNLISAGTIVFFSLWVSP